MSDDESGFVSANSSSLMIDDDDFEKDNLTIQQKENEMKKKKLEIQLLSAQIAPLCDRVGRLMADFAPHFTYIARPDIGTLPNPPRRQELTDPVNNYTVGMQVSEYFTLHFAGSGDAKSWRH
jgi:hypothetical protein